MYSALVVPVCLNHLQVWGCLGVPGLFFVGLVFLALLAVADGNTALPLTQFAIGLAFAFVGFTSVPALLTCI